MRIFGLEITRIKNLTLSPISSRGGWWPIIRESFTGAWQRNVEINREDVITYCTVYACITMIAADISKLWLKLVETDADGISNEIESSAFSPVLRKPNHYQTRVKFVECWFLSKLIHGNTYVLKERDQRGVVSALYVLDATRVKVLVAPDSSVFYQLCVDNLAGLTEDVVVPASEIIHDINSPLYHWLMGLSPILACGSVAWEGLKIQQQSSKFFASGLQISGFLLAPTTISTETAQRLETYFQSRYMGPNGAQQIAALGDNLKFEPMKPMSAIDAQLIDQLKMVDLDICLAFKMPAFKLNLGPPPPYTDIQSINLDYYNTCLQQHIENFESLMTEGLELPKSYSVEMDLRALLRMDTATQVENATKGIMGGLWKPNEARAEFDLKPVNGGDTVYLQQQQYSLAALDRRDSAEPAPPTDALTPSVPSSDQNATIDSAELLEYVTRELAA